jgi:hypothetical protein
VCQTERASSMQMSSSKLKLLYMCGQVGLKREWAWGRGGASGLHETGQLISTWDQIRVKFASLTQGHHPSKGLFALACKGCYMIILPLYH